MGVALAAHLGHVRHGLDVEADPLLHLHHDAAGEEDVGLCELGLPLQGDGPCEDLLLC